MLEPSFPKQQGHLLCSSYHAFRGLTPTYFCWLKYFLINIFLSFPSKSIFLLLIKLLINLDETFHFSGQIPCLCCLRQHIFLHGETKNAALAISWLYKPINYVFFPPHKTLVGQDLSQLSSPGGLTGLTGRGLHQLPEVPWCSARSWRLIAWQVRIRSWNQRSRGSYWE